MEATDEVLMQAVQNEKLTNLNTLYERYGKRIFNYFLKSTMDRDESNDLTQNVFLRVLKYRKSYKPGSSFEVWVFQIARNHLKDYFRKVKVHKDHFTTVEEFPEAVSESDLDMEVEKKLQKAMSQLPPDKRELLVMSKYQSMKYEQIAAVRETTVGAIKVQVHRTIAQLRDIYFQQNERE